MKLIRARDLSMFKAYLVPSGVTSTKSVLVNEGLAIMPFFAGPYGLSRGLVVALDGGSEPEEVSDQRARSLQREVLHVEFIVRDARGYWWPEERYYPVWEVVGDPGPGHGRAKCEHLVDTWRALVSQGRAS